ncbi:hypothetical protein V7O62_05750 [Methanolobus sp. ZRKC2]|uniref:hypothetical protein n=1 Tax=Methanolobus sp. ZRKC2 TaxID=3125783 RepID=UPI00324E9F70
MNDDELEEMIMKSPSARESVKMEHELLRNTASHPLRRKVVRSIGIFGKRFGEIKEDISIDDNSLKYHIDFLRNGEFLLLEDDTTYKLTDKGMDLLSDMSSSYIAK